MKKKKKNKCKNRNKCNEFNDFTIPPCAQYLGNNNPIIHNGKIIYRNNNRLYFFLSYNYSKIRGENYNPLNPLSFNTRTNGNLQIELYYFLIGLYINEVEKGNIEFDSNISIHDDKNADEFIKKVMGKCYDLDSLFVPSLTYVISNSSAVLPFYVGTIEISIRNFYIILMLSRFYSDYGLLFSDNAYVTDDFINRALADIYVMFNMNPPEERE